MSCGRLIVPCSSQAEHYFVADSDTEKYSLVKEDHSWVIHVKLDKLTETERKKCVITLVHPHTNEVMRIPFKERFEALPSVRREALVSALSDRSIYQVLQKEFAAKYQEIFNKYVNAYGTVHQRLDQEIGPSVPSGTPDFRLLADFKERPSVEFACRGDETVPVEFLMIASQSDPVLSMAKDNFAEKKEGKLTLPVSATAATAAKVVRALYGHGIELESDEEAADIFKIAQPYMMKAILGAVQLRAVRHFLKEAHPDRLIQPEVFVKTLEETAEEQLVSFYKETVSKIDSFYKDYLDQLFAVCK